MHSHDAYAMLTMTAIFMVTLEHTLISQDTNAIPTEYVLQPITDHFPHYNDLSEANREKNQIERDQWWQIFQSFQRVFKTTAKIAIERNKITVQQAHKYFSSGIYWDGSRYLFRKY